ncbi:MAG: amino acid ABC transporter substrate-binding protein [Dichotomicrobium sp.]
MARLILLVAALLFGISAAQAATLDDVREKGYIQCGVSQGLPGFSSADDSGRWTGIDTDFCRAVAAAVFGDPSKVRFTPLSAKERFTAIQSGEVDILSRNTTWTFSRDTDAGLRFVGVLYYDGQGFMVPRRLGVTSALELSGAEICTNTGTTTELNVADYFRVQNMPYKIVAFEKSDEAVQAYDAGRCDVYTSDMSGLTAQKAKLTNPSKHMLLPEVISKEPLGPAVRQGDPQWVNIVRWTLFALIGAEELGLSSQNIDDAMDSESPAMRRFLGLEGNLGGKVGLEKDWAYNAVKMVGNYGELFARNLGENSPLDLERGLNRLWTNGGLLYAPPIR